MWTNGALVAGDCSAEYIVAASVVPPPPNKAIQVLMYISIMHKNRSNKICFLWVLSGCHSGRPWMLDVPCDGVEVVECRSVVRMLG